MFAGIIPPEANVPKICNRSTGAAEREPENGCAQKHDPKSEQWVINRYMVVWSVMMVDVNGLAKPFYVSMEELLVDNPLLHDPDRHAQEACCITFTTACCFKLSCRLSCTRIQK